MHLSPHLRSKESWQLGTSLPIAKLSSINPKTCWKQLLETGSKGFHSSGSTKKSSKIFSFATKDKGQPVFLRTFGSDLCSVRGFLEQVQHLLIFWLALKAMQCKMRTLSYSAAFPPTSAARPPNLANRCSCTRLGSPVAPFQ